MSQFVQGTLPAPVRVFDTALEMAVKSANAVSTLDKEGYVDTQKFARAIVKALNAQGINARTGRSFIDDIIVVDGKYAFSIESTGKGKGKGYIAYLGLQR